MSVENHRHCQATVLGATGEPYGNGLTWNVINNGNFPNLDVIYSGWRNELFSRNDNMTQDLAGILTLINQLAAPISFPTFDDGDLIQIEQTTDDNNVIKVKNDFGSGYQGVVGVKGSGPSRKLTECNIQVVNENPDGTKISTLKVGDVEHPITIRNSEVEVSVENLYPDGPVIAILRVGDQEFQIRAMGSQPVPVEERYVITEDREYDIVLSGGINDGEPLDYTDELRYVVTESGHEYDIGVSGYGDSVLLNYHED